MSSQGVLSWVEWWRVYAVGGGPQRAAPHPVPLRRHRQDQDQVAQVQGGDGGADKVRIYYSKPYINMAMVLYIGDIDYIYSLVRNWKQFLQNWIPNMI